MTIYATKGAVAGFLWYSFPNIFGTIHPKPTLVPKKLIVSKFRAYEINIYV
jgi:hypothetical protein